MNIVANRRLWFSISGGFFIASLVLFLIFGLRLGLDFTGGIRWDIQFSAETEISDEALTNILGESAQITKTTDENKTLLIALPDISEEKITTIREKIKNEIGEYEEISFRKIDSAVGASFKSKAFWAVFWALIGIILYVWWAFRHIPEAVNPWRFGAITIVALVHDVMIVTGIFVLLGLILGVEVDLAFLTAILATFGFSVNDTIVILDRFRENLRFQKASETFADTIEKSIKQTVRRSIYTSLSTILPLLWIMGFFIEPVFYFALALTIGIAVGTYSSLFVVAPLIVTWKEWSDKREMAPKK